MGLAKDEIAYSRAKRELRPDFLSGRADEYGMLPQKLVNGFLWTLQQNLKLVKQIGVSLPLSTATIYSV